VSAPSRYDALRAMRGEMERELVDRILPFWIDAADDERGGFVGRVTGDGTREPLAPKGSILHARILWTFSAAYRALGDERLRAAAERARQFFVAHFVDPTEGGVYWMLDADGRPTDERKHVYAQAFAIYALAEHHRATGDDASLRDAVSLFRLLEAHAHDAMHRGYEEAFSRSWRLLDDVRLSAVDANERKSMNTHLHLLEAYSSLLRVWPDERLRGRLTELLELFIDRIVSQPRGTLWPFFDAEWRPRLDVISYGHDIEASWLIAEGADILGEDGLRRRAMHVANLLASAVLANGFDAGGGIYTERRGNHLDRDKEWWPQAEAIVGFLAAFERTRDERFANASLETWRFVRLHVLDRVHGEWHRRVSADGAVQPGHEKVGPWKCPYHNARACLEVMSRVDALVETPPGADGVARPDASVQALA
jgi:mannobiose 2-epimerase